MVFFEKIGDYFGYIWNQITKMQFSDILDIVIVSIIIYYVYKFVRQRRAGKLALGIVMLLLIMWISDIAGLGALNYLINKLFDVGLIALIVIFQPEMRSALEKMGGNIRNLNIISENAETPAEWIEELCEAIKELSEKKTGALIVLERTTRLGDEIKTGVTIDSEITSHLIKNIFYDKAPLHDGAMIIRNGRIQACGCFLPLTGNPNLPNEYGTRHRAGLGVSEISDAFVVIISEETGLISVARNGELDKGISVMGLKHRLLNEFNPKKKKNISRKGDGENGKQN